MKGWTPEKRRTAYRRFGTIIFEGDALMDRVLEMLRSADSDASRAAMLLRLGDEIVGFAGGELMLVLRGIGFEAGLTYLVCRIAAAAATRTENGQLPTNLAEQLERDRRALCAIAGIAP